jgi:hypothetical protein
MQFDAAIRGNSQTHYEQMKAKFPKMPQIVFWNLNGNTNDFPTTVGDNGVVLLSGYLPSLLNMVMLDSDISPLKIMLSILNSERYDRIIDPSVSD